MIFLVWFADSFVVDERCASRRLFTAFQSFPHGIRIAGVPPLMVLAHIPLSGALVWIYARGFEAKLPDGAGAALRRRSSAAYRVPTYLIDYVGQPMPGAAVAKQIVFDGMLKLLPGLVAAFV